MATIKIPSPLRKLCNEQSEVHAEGANIASLLVDLKRKYPQLATQILDDAGKLRSFVRVYLGEEDIQYLNKEDTLLQEDSIVNIIPAIAGGNLQNH